MVFLLSQKVSDCCYLPWQDGVAWEWQATLCVCRCCQTRLNSIHDIPFSLLGFLAQDSVLAEKNTEEDRKDTKMFDSLPSAGSIQLLNDVRDIYGMLKHEYENLKIFPLHK